MENIIAKAVTISILAHKDQTRKGDNLPYLVHPVTVALKLAKHNFSDTVIAAALAHDILEETEYREGQLRETLGAEVLRIVKAVTNDDSLPWEEKKKKYVETVKAGGEKAIAVSIADKIANLHSFFDQYEIEGPALWKKFNRGKKEKVWFEKEVLKMAKENWKSPLLDEYEDLIRKFERLAG